MSEILLQNKSQKLIPLTYQQAQELLNEFGSPLYVYFRNTIERNIEKIQQAIPYQQKKFHFASVTNGNVALMQIFRERGWGLHANSPGDVFLGLTAGFSGSDIVYSGSNLSVDEFRVLLEQGVRTINLDSISQLESIGRLYERDRYPHLRLGLRLNLPEVTGESRIGVSPNDLLTASRIASELDLPLHGIHFYRGTGTNATTSFIDAIDRLLDAGAALKDWQYLDFGGGFGFPYKWGSQGFCWQDFGCVLSQRLTQFGRNLELIIEPGRSAIAESGVLIATVVSQKLLDGKQIIGVDSTVTNIAVMAVHGGYREIVPLSETQRSAPYVVSDVCGNTTFSRDYLGRNCELPLMTPGDLIAITDVGGYGFAMSSHFLHRPKPAEVLLEPDSVRLIRRRETYDVLLANQLFVPVSAPPRAER